MTLTIKAKYLIIMAALLAVFAVFGFAAIAHANPFYTASKAQSGVATNSAGSNATSSVRYMTPGTATSTTIYDSYEQLGTNQTNQGNITIPDVLSWVLDGRASSTATVVNAVCEYSDNYNGTNGDWYQNEMFPATTSNPVNIATANSFTFTYASTTIGGAGLSGSDNRFQKIVTCPINTRFSRLIVSITGANAAVWVQANPKKQRNSGN